MNDKTYRVYTPWDSIVIDGKDERDAKLRALRQLQTEVEFATTNDLDAEEIEDKYQCPLD